MKTLFRKACARAEWYFYRLGNRIDARRYGPYYAPDGNNLADWAHTFFGALARGDYAYAFSREMWTGWHIGPTAHDRLWLARREIMTPEARAAWPYA